MNINKYKWWIIGGLTFAVLATATGVFIHSRKKNKGVNKKRLKNPNPKSVLLIGDSVSAILNYANNTPITYTYAAIVKSQLESEGIKVDVLAKGAEPTKWMLDNLPNKLKEKKYDRIYIYGGINDAWNMSIKPEVPFENIQKMVDLGNENGADVFVVLGYKIDNIMDYKKMKPNNKYTFKSEDYIPYIAEYKQFQSQLESKIKNANFMPIFDLQGQSNDGIHPSGQGHKDLAQIFINSIKG